jgi:hypothetical protein
MTGDEMIRGRNERDEMTGYEMKRTNRRVTINFVRGGKGRDFREILGERVGGTHFLAKEREEIV